ncbi:MAG: TolC family protein [Desulfovibrionaceae bacterium]|nr:TolC family protein [Desulfovibrionaceae bacterium]
MNRKRFLMYAAAIVIFMFAAGFAWAQDADPSVEADTDASISGPFDLERCVKRALERNPAMTAIRAQLKGAGYGTYSSMGDFGPSVSGTYGWTHYDRKNTTSGEYSDWVGSLSATQPVFHGFALLASYQKARLSEESTEASLRNVELTLIQSVQSNFLSLLKARMDVKSAEDSVARLESQLQVISAFYDVGLRPKAEVLDAEVDLASARQVLLTARNNVSTQEAQLNTLLNIPLQTNVEYVGELKRIPFDLTLKECLDRAYAERPDLVIGQKSVEIAEKDTTITQSRFYPSVDGTWNYVDRGTDADLGGGGNYTHRSSEYWTAGVTASMSLFESGSDFFNVKRASETVKQIQAELENTRLNAGFEVKRALLNIQEAADRIEVAEKSVTAAEEAYRMAVARYQAQVGTNTEVLNAQERLTSSEAQLSQAMADHGTAISALFVAMGEKNHGLLEAK